jgi:hypothetical protein
MRNRPVLTGNLPPLMHAFDSNASTHNIKTERVLAHSETLVQTALHFAAGCSGGAAAARWGRHKSRGQDVTAGGGTVEGAAGGAA